VSLKIYNTLSGTVEEFVPGGERKEHVADYPPVTMYSCGPTVYSYAHIGNFRTFLFNDFFRRYLKFRGFSVNHAMNITDVDDKTINGANAEGVSLAEYTGRYIRIFLEDLKTLNVEPVEHYPRATESIGDMVDLLERLDRMGVMYGKDGSLYFSIRKFEDYGRLSRLDSREIKTGLRYDTDEYEKDDVRDFALWKASRKEEPSWDTPFGPGRPGWHIECSAMVRRIFGTTIDVHTGGVDLIFPHHENEIAQSEAAYSEKFVRYWVHVEHLLVEGAKMSKSKGNFYTLRDLTEKGYSPRSIRFLLFSSHYRKQLNFTLEGLRQADQALERIDNFIIRLGEMRQEGEQCLAVRSASEDFIAKFIEYVDDDLNISRGIGAFFEYLHSVNSFIDEGRLTRSDADYVMGVLARMDVVFGFIFFPGAGEAGIDAERIESLIEERNAARRSKNFARSDDIRDMLLAEGIVLEDTRDGTRWKMKK
jgi:cysteinyl-tRNA synthetase